jgi:hypothetical protein
VITDVAVEKSLCAKSGVEIDMTSKCMPPAKEAFEIILTLVEYEEGGITCPTCSGR